LRKSLLSFLATTFFLTTPFATDSNTLENDPIPSSEKTYSQLLLEDISYQHRKNTPTKTPSYYQRSPKVYASHSSHKTLNALTSTPSIVPSISLFQEIIQAPSIKKFEEIINTASTRGFNVNLQTASGLTLLHRVVINEGCFPAIDKVRWLINHGANTSLSAIINTHPPATSNVCHHKSHPRRSS
jgi:hypothetical protein